MPCAFLRPLKAAGTPEVDRVSTCARVVAAGGMRQHHASSGQEAPALDPEEACLPAIDAGLLLRRAYPLNCEIPLPALPGAVTAPTNPPRPQRAAIADGYGRDPQVYKTHWSPLILPLTLPPSGTSREHARVTAGDHRFTLGPREWR